MLGVVWCVVVVGWVGGLKLVQLQMAFGMGRTENEHELCRPTVYLRLASQKKIRDRAGAKGQEMARIG